MSITALEAAIVARLEALLGDAVRKVYKQADYAAIPETSMVTPSVAVIYNGYTPGGAIRPGAIQSVEFGWLAVVNVRNARDSATGQGARDDASPLIDAVFEALLGWKPLPKFQALKLEPAPGAAVSDAGYGYFPLAFSTTGTYRGNP